MTSLSRRSFLKLFGASTLAGMAGSLGGMGYATQVEPGWVDVAAVPLALPGLNGAFDGYRIAQLSDLHIDDRFMDAARLDEIVRLANAQRPDLIVITGDFFTHQPGPHLELAHAALQRLEAADGVLAVLGNHDYWGEGVDEIRAMLAQSGVQLLVNATHSVERSGHALHIAGLDDLWKAPDQLPDLAAKAPDVEALAALLPADGTALLLAHEPDIADWAAKTGRFALQLSGHSHGGQVKIPFFAAPIVPPLGQKYPSGQARIESMIQYTSRGLGMIQPYVRFNCRPEIPLLTLTGEL